MAASLIVQASQVNTLQLDLQRLQNSFLSGKAVCHSDIGVNEIVREQTRVFAALCRSYFDNPFHGPGLSLQRKISELVKLSMVPGARLELATVALEVLRSIRLS
jgi:hypothetical protein